MRPVDAPDVTPAAVLNSDEQGPDEQDAGGVSIAEPPAESETVVTPKSRQKQDQKPKKQPRYAVVVHNDDDHSFAYVIELLMKVFGYGAQRCVVLTHQVHTYGRSVVWTGTKEVGELKRDQVRSGGPDFYATKVVRYPLGVTLEPLD